MNELRDPVHGFIELVDYEIKIVNTPVFQRLRKIKQLAMANLVYPGANHTRFDHSLGVFHVVSMMVRKLLPNLDEDKKRLIRYAALLHDIGHGPFSHISEHLLDKFSNLTESNKETSTEKIHELITRQLIEHNQDLNQFLSPEEKNNIIKLLSGDYAESPMRGEIVSGHLDADKIDYLMRDSYFCGVKYGIFDLERLLNTLVTYDDFDESHIGIKSGGINALEQFVLAKYYMTTQVYRHKVRLVSDAMIIRGIELGIEKDSLKYLRNLYTYRNDCSYLNNYLSFGDERLTCKLIEEEKEGYAKDIFKRLYIRNLFKTVFRKKIADLEENGMSKDKLLNIEDDLRVKLEKAISNVLPGNIKKEYVIVNTYTIKNVKEMSRNSEGKIMVIDNKRQKKEFEQESTVFSSIDEKMKDAYFEVYAPIDYENQKESKSLILGSIEREVLEILKSYGGSYEN